MGWGGVGRWGGVGGWGGGGGREVEGVCVQIIAIDLVDIL